MSATVGGGGAGSASDYQIYSMQLDTLKMSFSN